MSADADRLVDGRRIADVLAEDQRQRDGQLAERDEQMFEHYMQSSFPGVEPERRPALPTPLDPARSPAEPSDAELLDRYVEHHFPNAA